MKTVHIDGKDKGNVMIFALSTCGWCRRTKLLMQKLGVSYDFVDVDLAPDNEKEEIDKAISKWNPGGGFPTIVIDDKKCIIGYREDEIKELLG